MQEVFDLMDPQITCLFGEPSDGVYVLVGRRYPNSSYDEIASRAFGAELEHWQFDFEEVAAQLFALVAGRNSLAIMERADFDPSEVSRCAAHIDEGLVVVCVGLERFYGDLIAQRMCHLLHDGR